MTAADDEHALRLAQLLCARLCHELAGPVGALNNGAELLAEDPAMAGEAADLLGHSARAASVRLRYYRAAYGREESAAVPAAAELREVIADFLAAETAAALHIDLDWPAAGLAMPEDRGLIRLLLNLVVLGREALPRGGTLTPGLHADGPAVAVAGPGAGLGAEAAAQATGTAGEPPGPREAQAAWTAVLARHAGRILLLETGTDRLTVRAVPA